MGMIEERNEKRRTERTEAAEKTKTVKEPLKDIPEPETESIESVIMWHFQQTIFLLNKMSRDSAGARLRALNGAVDSFCKLKRLANDSEELENLKKDLDALKAELMKENKIMRVK